MDVSLKYPTLIVKIVIMILIERRNMTIFIVIWCCEHKTKMMVLTQLPISPLDWTKFKIIASSDEDASLEGNESMSKHLNYNNDFEYLLDINLDEINFIINQPRWN